MEPCKECPYLQRAVDKITECNEAIQKIAEKVGTLETNSAVDREKMANFTRMFEKIDKGICNIENKIEGIDKRPTAFWGKIVAGIIGSVGTFIFVEIIKKMGV